MNEGTSNNQYRDSVFCHYFKDKTRLLSLCNAILNTNYTDTDALTITTLPGTFFKKQKNDISCTIGGKSLVLVEHQTILSENLPFRCLSYVTELLNNLVEDKRKLYQPKLIKFPTPEFIVLYNGDDDAPLKKEMKLSDAFNGDAHSLELKLTAYNINYGVGQDLLTKCKYLKNYSVFVDKVKDGARDGLSLNDAIKNAVKYCIENNVMKEYLKENAKEVFTMAMLEYDENEAREAWKEYYLEEGMEKGREEGMEKGIIMSLKNIMKKLKLSSDAAMEFMEIPVSKRAIYGAKLSME